MAKRLGWLASVLFVVACASSDPLMEGASGSGAGSGGRSGTGDVGGSSGSAGANGDAGIAGTTGAGGGGVGGDVSDAGGAAGDCATGNAGGRCAELARGWSAIKVTLDVWWPGTPVSDPGRGDVELAMLARLDDNCGTDNEPTAELKLCGVELPITTSDVECDAHELSFDEAIWDSPRMRRFSTTANVATLSPGEVLSLVPWTGLFGLDLLDASEELPAPGERASVSCADGSGLACFPDHDDDEQPGLTLIARHDGATYEGPYGNGLCSPGIPYRFHSPPAIPRIAGGVGALPRAAKVHIGMRAHTGIAPEIARNCASAAGDATSDKLELRAAGCVVEPASLSEGEERLSSGDFTCSEVEWTFVAETLPQYRVLRADEAPGETMRSLGWANVDRDIPRTPSGGPRSALIHLADISEPEPTCQTVRTMFDPESD